MCRTQFFLIAARTGDASKQPKHAAQACAHLIWPHIPATPHPALPPPPPPMVTTMLPQFTEFPTDEEVAAGKIKWYRGKDYFALREVSDWRADQGSWAV